MRTLSARPGWCLWTRLSARSASLLVTWGAHGLRAAASIFASAAAVASSTCARLTAARKEALGNAFFNKITAVNCVLDAALLTVDDGKAVVTYLDSLPPDPRTSTAGCAPGAVEGVVVVGFPLGTKDFVAGALEKKDALYYRKLTACNQFSAWGHNSAALKVLRTCVHPISDYLLRGLFPGGRGEQDRYAEPTHFLVSAAAGRREPVHGGRPGALLQGGAGRPTGTLASAGWAPSTRPTTSGRRAAAS